MYAVWWSVVVLCACPCARAEPLAESPVLAESSTPSVLPEPSTLQVLLEPSTQPMLHGPSTLPEPTTQAEPPEPPPGPPHPRCPPSSAGRCLAPHSQTDREQHFQVNGHKISYTYVVGDYFSVKCPEGVTLEEPALPRFEPLLEVSRASLECALGPRGAAAPALARLGVRALDKLALRGGRVDRGALAGLAPAPRRLELASLRLDRGALLALPDLRALRLEDVPLQEEDLLALPAALQNLTLVRVGLARVGGAALARLPALALLLLRAAPAPAVAPELDAAAAPALREMAATGAGALQPALPPSLRALVLHRWTERSPPRFTRCAGLETLELRDGEPSELVEGWVSRCGALRELRVSGARGLVLAPRALAGAAALRDLSLARCGLRALPSALLADARALERLNLAGNRLLALPSLAPVAPVLVWLDAADNQLGNDAVSAAGALRELRELDLSGNAALDACPAPLRADLGVLAGTSALAALRGLRALRLRGTRTARVCADWRARMPRLAALDLRRTPLRALAREDVQFTGRVNVTLDVRGCALTRLAFERADADALLADAGPGVTVRADGALACDCGDTWAALALRGAARVRLRGARCADGRAWDDVSVERLECALGAGAGCPAGCECAWRERAAAPGRALRVTCAGLRGVPALGALARGPAAALRLQLAHRNSVPRLRAAELPRALEELDVRNVSLAEVEPRAAAALAAAGARLLLADNPLRCSCEGGGAAGLRALLAAPSPVFDLALARCADGSPLAAAPLDCASAPALYGALAGAALALALLATLGAALCRPAARRALRRCGLLPRGDHYDPKKYRFDVFISFAAADAAPARQLAARLEAAPSGRRACLHQRDWAPGGWIPAQIAASVRTSRTTLVLLSEAFARSAWARAEFRAAQAEALRERGARGAAAPRLVCVLLAPRARLAPALDAELRDHLADNTYLEWADPHFWRKLERALPPPPPPAPDPAPEPRKHTRGPVWQRCAALLRPGPAPAPAAAAPTSAPAVPA